MVEKSPDAFRTISEVANDLDVPQHVLRFWETRFSQVKPMKRGGGRRYYRPDDVELLRGIRHLLYGDGYTIKGVQRILRENGVRHVIGLGKSLHHDAVNGTGSADGETASASPSMPAVPVGEGRSDADSLIRGEPTPPADLPETAETSASEQVSPQENDSTEAEETIDFSASRSVLVRRRQQDADGVEAMPVVPAAPAPPTAADVAVGMDAALPADEAAPTDVRMAEAGPTHAVLPDAGSADLAPAAVATSPPPSTSVHNDDAPSTAAEASPDHAKLKAEMTAATAGLDEDDIIRLQAAVFELLECRRILSEQD